jgi:hypothetical protein
MGVNREALKSKFSWMPRDELLELHAAGTLSDEAYEVLECELSERGVAVPPRPKREESSSIKPAAVLPCPITSTNRLPLRIIAAFEVISGGLQLSHIVFSMFTKFGRLQVPIFDIPLAILSILAGILLWRLHPRGIMISLLVQAAYAIKIYFPSFAYAPDQLISFASSFATGGYGFGIDFVALVLFGYLLHTVWKWREAKAQ